MSECDHKPFPGPVTIFHERRLPVMATPAGYAALIDSLCLHVPLPRTLLAIGEKHRIIHDAGWRILTPRHAPPPTLAGHLTFALKHEGLDLAALKRIFEAAGPKPVEAIIRKTPTGAYGRRLWFLYEWLTDERLDLPDAERGPYVPVVDPNQQYAIDGVSSSRHRVRNNLPGTSAFCPLVFRSPEIDAFIATDLASKAREAVAAVPKDILARAAAFLLLKDSRSSYAIEGEHPPQNRIQRWGRAIGEAGKRPMDLDELLRLQEIVIGDARFVHLGLRTEGGFVGEHDRITREPLPAHIDARAEDLPSLVQGLVDFDQGAARELDPVIAAAVLAFGFVYIHPFEDGNGRIHRYLIHHVLAQRGFNPPGVVFPVSSTILQRIDAYKVTLADYAARLLPHIEWRSTPQGNVEVLNDTADFYRYFDATAHALFLFGCVEETIEEDLPYETLYLQSYDAFRAQIQSVIDMPDRTVDLLCRFLQQGKGKLSKRARQRTFASLTDQEVQAVQSIFSRTIGALPHPVKAS